jgi:hypothetical protein
MRYEDMKPEDFYQLPHGEKPEIVNSWAEVPQFKDETSAVAYWETHTLATHLWSQKRGLSPAAERYLKEHPEARRTSAIN